MAQIQLHLLLCASAPLREISPRMPALDAQSSRRSSWLRFCALAAFTTLAFVGARLWFIDGLVRRVLIDGPSMAPTFCGEHYEVRCHDCGVRFTCDASNVPSDGLAACP